MLKSKCENCNEGIPKERFKIFGSYCCKSCVNKAQTKRGYHVPSEPKIKVEG